jgi:hypothetical protein
MSNPRGGEIMSDQRILGHRWLDAILTLEYSYQIRTARGRNILKAMEIKTYQELGWDIPTRNINRSLFQSEQFIKDQIKKENEKHERKPG